MRCALYPPAGVGARCWVGPRGGAFHCVLFGGVVVGGLGACWVVWRNMRGAASRVQASARVRLDGAGRCVCCTCWLVCGRWRMISVLIIRMLSCVCSVRLARHGDTVCESGTRCAATSANLQGWGLGGGRDREVAPFAACCLVVWLLGGWGRAGSCGGTCVARHPGCTRLHVSVRSAPAGAAVARGGLCVGGGG